MGYSYKGLGRFEYVHKSVYHSEEFASEEGVHINSLEYIHGELNVELKIVRGMDESQTPGFLDQFCHQDQEDFFTFFIDKVAATFIVNELHIFLLHGQNYNSL